MQVEDVDAVGPELAQGFFDVGAQRRGRVAGEVRLGRGQGGGGDGVELGGEGEVAGLVARGGGDGFLGAVLVGAGCVELRVAGGLEVVEEEGEVGEGGGAGAPFDVLGGLDGRGKGVVMEEEEYRAKGHDWGR